MLPFTSLQPSITNSCRGRSGRGDGQGDKNLPKKRGRPELLPSNYPTGSWFCCCPGANPVATPDQPRATRAKIHWLAGLLYLFQLAWALGSMEERGRGPLKHGYVSLWVCWQG